MPSKRGKLPGYWEHFEFGCLFPYLYDNLHILPFSLLSPSLLSLSRLEERKHDLYPVYSSCRYPSESFIHSGDAGRILVSNSLLSRIIHVNDVSFTLKCSSNLDVKSFYVPLPSFYPNLNLTIAYNSQSNSITLVTYLSRSQPPSKEHQDVFHQQKHPVDSSH